MTPLALVFLALVCSVSGTTAPADHGRALIPDELHDDIPGTNPRLAHLYRKPSDNAMRQYVNRAKRDTTDDPRCTPFLYKSGVRTLTNPMNPEDQSKPGDSTYSNHTMCITTIVAPDDDHVVILSFVDKFEMEDRPPKCEYDYLEIRDGQYGYALPVYRFCGKNFPATITSAGRYMWLKFKSDDSIEYAGFKINIEFQPNTMSRKIPPDCTIAIADKKFGVVASDDEDAKKCKDQSPGALDIQWRIETPAGTRIYLNFTHYKLDYPNECEVNLVQVFGAEPNFDHKLAFYCGSVANPVTTKSEDEGLGASNVMYIRMYVTNIAKTSRFAAEYTSFRTLKADQKCDELSEFDCQDGTCIDNSLICDHTANCRLKADEDPEGCKEAAQSVVKEPHILVILVIFSLILSGMSFVFLFKCIRKLYQDHKYIKEHLAKSCEDRLDKLAEAQLTLDPSLLGRDTEPRASLERDNHTNEMYKQQRNKRKENIVRKPAYTVEEIQKVYVKSPTRTGPAWRLLPIPSHPWEEACAQQWDLYRLSSSIESDYIRRETSLEHDDWPESVPIPNEDVRMEYKARPRRGNTSKREESLRSKGPKEEERKENRDASVGAPDTKESGCQTRESLFQVDSVPSSDGTNSSNSRGFSTFGYSGATIVRPSPAPANTSQITIELLRQVTPQESIKSQKKLDRRPMSSETTRSAPDVIIVSKPIR